MNEKDRNYILDILDSIKHIGQYIQGSTEKVFTDSHNHQLQDSVIRRLEIIGEAAKNYQKRYMR